MKMMKPDSIEPFSSTIDHIEKELSIPSGFFNDLFQENDWSFVIKAHAFVEAALSHLLATHLEKPDLKDIFARISISNTSTGKIAFGRQLGILDAEDVKFIRELSSIRNKLVHGVGEINFNFHNYFYELKEEKRRDFARSISFVPSNADHLEGVDIEEVIQGVMDDPKMATWYGVMFLATKVYLQEAFLPLFIFWILIKQISGNES